MRIDWVFMVHQALVGDTAGQGKLAKAMSVDYGLLEDRLQNLSYNEALAKARSLFVNLPYCSQNTALKAFLGVRLNYLTPNIALGIRGLIMPQLLCFL